MKLIKRFHNTQGFTLIELLIVIALLGALAVGLIGAIDPFEQLKKGTDTGLRDLVSQVQTAVIRYYSVKNALPDWSACTGGEPSSTPVNDPCMTTAISNIVASGELRSDFTAVQGAKLANIFVTAVAGSDTSSTVVSVCYQPQSKSFQSDPNTKYNKDGTPNAGTGTAACISAATPGTTHCYWCIQ